MVVTFWLNGKEYQLAIRPKSGELLSIAHGDRAFDVSAEFITEEEILLRVNGRVYNVVVQSNSLAHTVTIGDRKYIVEKRSSTFRSGEEKTRARRREIRITMPGKVVAVQVEEGAEVKQGQPVLILEAMKMQNEIKAPQDGRVSHLKVQPGDTVEAGTVLFIIE